MIYFKLFRSKAKRIALAFSLLQVTAVGSFGAVVYDTTAVAEMTGSRTNLLGGGVDTVQFNNTAGNHFTVAWVITNPTVGTWHYSYTFTGTATTGGQGLSHFILDTSDTCINLAAGTLADPNCIKNPTWTITPANYTATPSNPNFPAGAAIIGAKFNVVGGPALPATITFDSDRAPVYGDFYVKVANSTSAYNNGLGIEGTSTLLSDFIAMPGELTPEPDTAVLMLAGAALVGIGKLLRFRHPTLQNKP